MSQVKLSNIVKHYDDGTQVIHGIDLRDMFIFVSNLLKLFFQDLSVPVYPSGIAHDDHYIAGPAWSPVSQTHSPCNTTVGTILIKMKIPFQ